MANDATNDDAHVNRNRAMTNLNRRAFFLAGTQKLAKVAIDQVEARAEKRAKYWIRPPFALSELDFLTTCTRCGACQDACPHQVIFPLPSRLGAIVANTPALDLKNKGCHLCEDWSCVKSCKPGALKFPQVNDKTDSPPIPQIAKASINIQSCLPYKGPECGACASSCPIPGALNWHSNKPSIDSEHCIGCGFCRETCIVEPKAIEIKSLYADEERCKNNKL